MHPSEVLRIFEEKKSEYLRNIPSDIHPIGILLGGQGAVGKGQLNLLAEQLFPEKEFLTINGDIYRSRHPLFHELRKNVWDYSKNTQVFSNVFTERLIDEAVKASYSFIVEGTMRNSDVPIRTATMIRQNSYRSAAFVIAAPIEFSLLNVYNRYYRELQKKGFGRMVDLESHYAAVDGLPKSLDRLYQERAIDMIFIFDCFAKNLIKEYHLHEGEWDCCDIPSGIIYASREEQLKDRETISDLLLVGRDTVNGLDGEMKQQAISAFNRLKLLAR